MKLSAMLRLSNLIGILLLTSCSKKVYLRISNLYGKQTGEGKFKNTKVNEKIGTIYFDIEINQDNTVTVTIGGAEITKSKIARHVTFRGKDGYAIKCKMEGKMNGKVDFKKRINILMYVEGKNEIRTNFFYGGRVGSLRFIKSTD